jgi:hypothetical protein
LFIGTRIQSQRLARCGLQTRCSRGEPELLERINRRQLKELIEVLTNRGNWTFAYLGSDPSTFTEAADMGVPSHRTRSYRRPSAGMVGAHAAASLSTSRSMASNKLQDEHFCEGVEESISG